jgi:hypothetical protein
MTQELYNQRKLEYDQREEMIRNIRGGVEMKMQDLRVLKMKLEGLTDEEQLKIYDIIVDNDEKEALAIKYSSVLFDLEQLSSKTLWELNYFVKQCEWSKTQTMIDQDVKMKHVEHMTQLNNSLLEQSKKQNETEKEREIEREKPEIMELSVSVPTTEKITENTSERVDTHPTEMTIDKLFELSKSDVKLRRTRKPRQSRKTSHSKQTKLSSQYDESDTASLIPTHVPTPVPKKRGRRKVRIISDVNQ